MRAADEVLEKLSQQLVFMLIARRTSRSSSMAGDGGLFINYFTHSEIANGMFLFCARLHPRRIIAAMAMTV